MEVTREKHLQYISNLAPFLILAVIAQVIVYRYFLPDMAVDITIFLSSGLAAIILGFAAYDYCHRVYLRENYLEIKIAPFKYQDEILYRNITFVEILPTKRQFSHVRLYMRDGSSAMIYYVDDAQGLKRTILKKQG